jgi:hypothetical protein
MPRKPKSPDPAAGHDSVDRDRLRTLVARIESAEDERIATQPQSMSAVFIRRPAATASTPAPCERLSVFAGRTRLNATSGRLSWMNTLQRWAISRVPDWAKPPLRAPAR